MTLKSAGLADFTAQIQSIVTTGNSLKPFYDRNASSLDNAYENNAIAPHAFTSRWSYTVPANRKALMHSAVAWVYRDGTNAGAIGQATAQINKNSKQICAAICYQLAMGGLMVSNLSNQMWLVAGDVIVGGTADGSAGGTTSLHVSATFMEYDA